MCTLGRHLPRTPRVLRRPAHQSSGGGYHDILEKERRNFNMENTLTDGSHTINKGRARADSDSDVESVMAKKVKTDISDSSTCETIGEDDKLQRIAQAMKTIIEVIKLGNMLCDCV